ncbi:MAG: type IV pilin N-terminal domain-containing protein [Euryarchaeota archaeon]|nr:type IV pilin N-terminal domain-containing protein [Euryarchaeota archaeon]
MKRIWKKNDGVSPVIATILMVAITVVLAAVLYVMVSGYMSGGGGGEPYVTFTAATSVNATTWSVESAPSRAEALSSYKLILLANTTTQSTMNPIADGTSGSLKFVDVDTGGKLTTGDKVYITCVPGTTYELNIYWVASGAKVGTVKWTT